MKLNWKSENLLGEYTDFLRIAFNKKFWNGGSYSGERIYWNNANKAKKQIEEFHNPGIYIWGYGITPKYIGKAEKQTLAKRFSRYAYGSKAQYRITELYWNHLLQGGSKKIIDDLIVEHSMSPKNHRTRCSQAIKFAEEMTDNAWFLFIPLNESEVDEAEDKLILCGNLYNKRNGLQALMNKMKTKKSAK
jgi:hypothetical protein